MQVQAAADASPTDWARRVLAVPGSTSGLTVDALVPAGYESYARVFHKPWWPAPEVEARSEELRGLLRTQAANAGQSPEVAGYSSDEIHEEFERLAPAPGLYGTWKEIAEAHGKISHPLMQWHQIATTKRNDESLILHGPGLEPHELSCLVEVLTPFTSTPEHCSFCVWDGYGFEELQRSTAPRAKFFHVHLVFEGEIESALQFIWDGFCDQPPNMWWPEDRAWFVATEIDECATYVGGSKQAVEAVLAHSDLEALPIREKDRIDAHCDVINGSPQVG